MTSITIENVTVRYAEKPVIDGLSLRIESGTFFTLLGPSGCGKTTLLRTIAGFVQASAGRIQFGNRDVTHLPAYQRDIGMVFQDYALFPDKTVFDNVAYGLHARKQDAATISRSVGEALERVGLGDLARRQPAALSGGQRQRVALARALVIQPQVLLMDEPLSNLDAKLRVQVRETIAHLQAQAGITTVFVTHDQEEALALSHTIGVMNQGRLEQVGTPAQVYAQPRTAYVADFVGGANLLSVQISASLGEGESATLQLGNASVRARAGSALSSGIALLMVRPESVRLLKPSNDSNALSAQIMRRQYLGERTRYNLKLAGCAETFHAICHGTLHDQHRVGDSVDVALEPTACVLLAP